MRRLDLTQEPTDNRAAGDVVPIPDNVKSAIGFDRGTPRPGHRSGHGVAQSRATKKVGVERSLNPPQSNAGVIRGSGGSPTGESEGQVEACFDWYGATINDNPVAVLERLALALGADVRTAKPRNGYAEAFELVNGRGTVATVRAGGAHSKPYAWASGDESDEFAEAVRRLWPEAHAVSRMDSRIDFGGNEGGSHTWDTLFFAVAAFAKSRNLMTVIHGDYLGAGEGGRTLYVGSRESVMYLRLYEKSKEMQARSRTRNGEVASDWVRIEVEVKPKQSARQRATTSTALDAWGYAKWTRNLLNHLIGLEVPRIQISTWHQSDDERTFGNFVRQYGPVIRRMTAAEGWAAVAAR